MAFASINRQPMNKKLSVPVIEEAFAAEPILKERVYDAIGAYNYPSKKEEKKKIGLTITFF